MGRLEMKGQSTQEAGETDQRETPLGSKGNTTRQGAQSGLYIVALVLRVLAVMGTLSGAVVMGTANETLPFSTRSSQFRADYNDLPMFTFFVIANSIACGYLFLCLPLSIFQMMEVIAITTRVILLIFDTVVMALVISGASAAASIVYLAYQGNTAANWLAFCTQFNSFCHRILGSLIASFSTILILMLLIIISVTAISRHPS